MPERSTIKYHHRTTIKNILILIGLFIGTSVFGQSKLPVIQATSSRVAINDGGYLDKNAWTLAPYVSPDIYTSERTRKTKWVIFYTDIDSIKVRVKPGTKFNFIVLLNGKDTCLTQIASAISPLPKIKNRKSTHDTIPFILTSYNAIQVQSILNETDTLNLHFDVGSFDVRFTKEAIVDKTKLLTGQLVALLEPYKPDYNHLAPINTLKMGNLVWTKPTVVVTTLTAHGMDGRFGWNLFEGKVVEIDYDKSVLIIHSQPPKNRKGYVKSKIEFLHSFVCIQAALDVENKQYKGNFLLDTGSDQAMILDSTWAARQNFPRDLKLLKRSSFSDPRGVTYENRIVLAPLLTVNGSKFPNVPATLLGSKNPVNFEVNYLGNDLLKRFNTIIDFQNDCIYLKPNKLANLPYRENP